jgi:hypothetical protein
MSVVIRRQLVPDVHHRIELTGDLIRQQPGAGQRDHHPPPGGIDDVTLHIHEQTIAALFL